MKFTFWITLVSILSSFFLIESTYAGYSRTNDIYLYGTGNTGGNGIIAFSPSPTVKWVSPVNATRLDTSNLFHGHVWVDSIGWSTFDHGVAGQEAKISNGACIVDTTKNACPISGYLWSRNVGWIRFSGNSGAGDVEFYKPTMTLSGSAWNNQVGWINMDEIVLILGPTTPSFSGGVDLGGGDFALATTGSILFSSNVSAKTLTTLRGLGSPTTMQVCIQGGTYCTSQTLNTTTGKFDPALDFSLATDYTYTITDPFGNETTGTIHVYAGPVISNGTSVLGGDYLGIGLYKKYCEVPSSDPVRCPDASPRTSYVNGSLTNGDTTGGKYADNNDEYDAGIELRDAYGNPIKSEAGVKTVTLTLDLNSTLDFVSTPHEYQYGASFAGSFGGDAYNLEFFGNTMNSLLGPTFTSPYSNGINSIRLRSYAPSTVGNSSMASDNDINIASVTATVTNLGVYSKIGEGSYNITSMMRTTPLPFLPLADITSINGFEDIQMGRLSNFTGNLVMNVSYTDSNIDPNSSYVIQSVAIGNNTTSTTATFQDLNSALTTECLAFTHSTGVSTPGYVGYCARLGDFLASPASVITHPFNGSREISFQAIPRKIVEVDLSQGYIYDSLIRYTIDGVEVIYPSFHSQTNGASDKIFGNAVKVIGQMSGKNIYQTIVTTDQSAITTLSRSESINTVRKNVGLLTRNVTYVSDFYSGSEVDVYKKDISINPQSTLISRGKRTVVAYGDITVTDDLISTNDSTPLAIIALKDENGNGGNIFIKSNVKRIDASIIAQGTLFSGEKGGSATYYAQDGDAVNILKNQLYIYGKVISLNTIGGASLETGSKCPSLDITCNNSNALIYDFEHMRYFRGGAPEKATLARSAAQLSDQDKLSSFIIEFNPETLKNPPPGMEIIN